MLTMHSGSDGNRTLTQIIAEREQKMKEGDKLQMQKVFFYQRAENASITTDITDSRM